VKASNIFLNVLIRVDPKLHQDKDLPKDIIALVTSEMFLHIVIDLNSILLVKSLCRNIVSGRIELGVEVVECALEIVLKFVHVVGGHDICSSFVNNFLVVTISMRVSFSWNRRIAYSYAERQQTGHLKDFRRCLEFRR
jgi:hypothetical protein